MNNTINLLDYATQVFQAPPTCENAAETTPAINPMEIHARNYRAIQAQIKALEEQQDLIKAEMIAEMDAQQAEEVRAGEYTIRYKLVSSNRFDSTAFKKTHPALYADFTKESVSTRFTVS